MKHFFTYLLILVMTTAQAYGYCLPRSQEYVCVIASPDLANIWSNFQKYKPDQLRALVDWKGLPDELRKCRVFSGNKRIVLDFHVHGSDDGLYLGTPMATGYWEWDRANFGYVMHHIQKELAGREVVILFESCYAGRAYKKTIRGAVIKRAEDDIYNLPNPAGFAVFGCGDAFAVWGNIMYIQYRHNIRKWWVDLTEYDSKGKDRPLMPLEVEDQSSGLSPTTAAQQIFWNFFARHIPLI